jgi:putative PIG3 family NAD(P)H quinone oxidoreductase
MRAADDTTRSMRAVLLDGYGDESVLRLGTTLPLTMGPEDLRIRVSATAVNRADILQREGHYPPPHGASSVLGMECAGVVAQVGDKVRGWREGDRAMALLAGGGYAEEVVVDAGCAMKVPKILTDEEAAALPEVFLTAFMTIFELAGAREGETVLIHGGGSGVGTAGTTLCRLAGMRVVVTAGSDEKCARCLEHGAHVAINYRREDFVARAGGVDVILDHVGPQYLARDLEALRVDGRVVLIGTMGGGRNAEIDVRSVLSKRLHIIGSTLRGRDLSDKRKIVKAFLARFGADLKAGRVRPVIDSVHDWTNVAIAHRRMNAEDHFGKVVLRVA